MFNMRAMRRKGRLLVHKWRYLLCILMALVVVLSPLGHLAELSNDSSYSLDYSVRHNLDIDVRPKNIFNKESEIFWEEDMKTIPHIIHQTAKSQRLRNVFKPWMKSWLEKNPKWQHWYWTDYDIREFITTRYPQFMPVFDSYGYAVQQSDVFRYFVLYEFGGFYADTDVECLKSLDAAVAKHDCIIMQEPPMHALHEFGTKRLIANSMMASRPQQPFLKFIINNLVLYRRHWDILYSTGPFVVDSAYDAFVKAQALKKLTNIPYLAHWDDYQPKFDPRQLETYKQFCRSKRRNIYQSLKDLICQDVLSDGFTNGPKNRSITIHHFTHMWFDKTSKFGVAGVNGSFHIQQLFSNRHLEN